MRLTISNFSFPGYPVTVQRGFSVTTSGTERTSPTRARASTAPTCSAGGRWTSSRTPPRGAIRTSPSSSTSPFRASINQFRFASSGTWSELTPIKLTSIPGPRQVRPALSAVWEAGEVGQAAGHDLRPGRGRDERDPGAEAGQQVQRHRDGLHVGQWRRGEGLQLAAQRRQELSLGGRHQERGVCSLPKVLLISNYCDAKLGLIFIRSDTSGHASLWLKNR